MLCGGGGAWLGHVTILNSAIFHASKNCWYIVYLCLFYLSFHRTKTNQLKETALRPNILAKQIIHMHTQSKTSGPFSMTGQYMCVWACS